MMRANAAWLLLAALPPAAHSQKLTAPERIEILRGMLSEYATAKVPLPRSKKPLPLELDGKFDKPAWEAAGKEFGPAARVGDLVQITKVVLDDDRIVLEINGGLKAGRKWYHNVEVGMGTSTRPAGGPYSSAPGGTTLALLFRKPLPPMKAAEIKKVLAPVLDFEKHSATESYVEALPPPIQKAIKAQKAIEGMDREQVVLALGRPRHKVRETKEGEELEDWIYGDPPGKITFVTFKGSKVVRVKENYAGLGGQTAPPLPPQ